MLPCLPYTDADGRYEAEWVALDAPLWVWAEGGDRWASAETESPIVLTADRPEGFVRLRLGVAGAVRILGRWGPGVEPPGENLDRVTITSDREPRERWHALEHWNPVRRTLRGLEPGPHRITLRSDRAAPTVLEVEVVPGQTIEREVVFEPGVALAGTVVDSTGAPVARLPIEALGESGFDAYPLFTDEQGRWRIERLRRGPHRIRVGDELSPDSQVHEVEAPNEDLRWVAPRLATVRVRFPTEAVDPTSEYGYAEATPQLFQQHCETADGVVTWTGPASTTRLRFGLDDARVEREVALVPGADLDLGEVVPDLGRPVDLVVVGPTGAPIHGARLWTERDEASDDLGRIHLRRIDTGGERIFVHADGFLGRWVLVEPPADGSAVTVTLTLGGVLECRVVTEAGRAARDLLLAGRPLASVDADDEWRAGPHCGDGRFRVTLAPGEHEVTVREGPEGKPLATARATLVEGQETLLTLRIP
jgi:hypothetical protein